MYIFRKRINHDYCLIKKKNRRSKLRSHSTSVEIKFEQSAEEKMFTDWYKMKKYIKKMLRNRYIIVRIVLI